jgi:hypothetical protein
LRRRSLHVQELGESQGMKERERERETERDNRVNSSGKGKL